ncbi:uncharacterized protein LOC135202895 [Macrobrachium nipponense]|uniref:uncharacterized protein LOC135202895 n=1 Tax=Macrobrachium nipponense TaxID=159736 RepID=UPI0030C7FEB3
MDVLSEEIRNEELCEFLYADHLVITAENEEDLQRRVGECQESLERGCLKETRALRRKEEVKLERTEIRMLRWIMGISLLERLEDDEIRRKASLVKITEVIRESRLSWYGHVLRMDDEEKVKSAWEEPIRERRSRWRQRIRCRSCTHNTDEAALQESTEEAAHNADETALQENTDEAATLKPWSST